MTEDSYDVLDEARTFFAGPQTVDAYTTLVSAITDGDTVYDAVEQVDDMDNGEVTELFEAGVEADYFTEGPTVTDRGHELVEYAEELRAEYEERMVPGLPDSLQPWNVGSTSVHRQHTRSIPDDDSIYDTSDIDEQLQQQKRDKWNQMQGYGQLE